MRRFSLLLALSIVGTFFVSLGANGADKSFDITQIKVSFQDTPIFNYQNINDTARSSNRGRWAVIEIHYTPNKENSRTGWYDDITMEAEMIMISDVETVTGTKNSSEYYIAFTGKTRFFTIEADNKNHVGLMFVPAKLMDRFYTKGRSFALNMFAATKVSFYTKGRILLGEGYWTPSGSDRRTGGSDKLRYDFSNFDTRFPNSLKLPGGIYSKEKTPWAFYNYDQTDLIYEDEALGSANKSESK